MSNEHLKPVIEAALFAAGEPITVERLQQLFEPNNKPNAKELTAVLEALREDYQNRSLELVEVASGYRFQVRRDYAPWLQRLWEKRPARYSRALLETLALVAYRQPITRGEIEDVRGVAISTNIMKILQEREWVKVVGYKDVPGKPALYATTKNFLDYFNLKSINELPSLQELMSMEEVEQKLQRQFALDVDGIEQVGEMQTALEEPEHDIAENELIEDGIPEDEMLIADVELEELMIEDPVIDSEDHV
ncbi:MAG TPA: SMC-Scp complex subunit ScpB [Coxiellaceae bacterium]|nr:SMC-Scp complex subunit ScpB [Coxiellaceae bacterium]